MLQMCKELCGGKKEKDKKKDKKDKHGNSQGKDGKDGNKHKMKNVHQFTIIGQGKKNTD